MPIYQYYCEPCKSDWKEIHGADDKGGKCENCGTYANKKLSGATTINLVAQSSSPGQRIEKYIEETREAVKQEIIEARKEYKI